MTNNVLRTILEHQEQSRKLLEEVILELKNLQDMNKNLAVLETRVDALERAHIDVVENCKECKRLVNGKFSGIQKQFHEDSKETLQARQDLLDRVMAEVSRLDDRLDVLEQRAADLGGRYGVVASFAAFIVLEMIRWFLKSAKHG